MLKTARVFSERDCLIKDKILSLSKERKGRSLTRAKTFLIRTGLLIIKVLRQIRTKKRRRGLPTKKKRRRVLRVFADQLETSAEKPITTLMTFLMQLMLLKELILKMLLPLVEVASTSC